MQNYMNRKTVNAEMMTKSRYLIVLLIKHNVLLHLNINYYDIKINQVQNAVTMKLMHPFIK